MANKQKKGKDPGLLDYGIVSTDKPPSLYPGRENRDYSGWEPTALVPKGAEPGIIDPDSKNTRVDIMRVGGPPYYVAPGSDIDRPAEPKGSVEPARSYGYFPKYREEPTRDKPADGPGAQFSLPLPAEQLVGDPGSQGKPTSRSGSGEGPGRHGPIKYVTAPDPKAPPSASRQPPFDVVRTGEPVRARVQPADATRPGVPYGERQDTEGDRNMVQRTGEADIWFREKPKSDEPGGGLPRSLYPQTGRWLPGGSGTTLPSQVKGVKGGIMPDDYVPGGGDPGGIGSDPHPGHNWVKQPDSVNATEGGEDVRKEPGVTPWMPGKTYPSFAEPTKNPPAVQKGVEPGDVLFRRQRKPDPDETKSGNQ